MAGVIDDLPYWQFEEYIKIINDIVDEENTQRKKDEAQQQQNMPNVNSYLKNLKTK